MHPPEEVHKSGWKTTEFWVTLTTQGVAMAVLFGVMSKERAVGLEDALSDVIAAVFAMMTSLGSQWKYAGSRSEVKKAELKASSEVVSANVTAAYANEFAEAVRKERAQSNG